MGLLLFFVILALPILILFFLRKHRHKPPGPLGLPFIGNLLQLTSSPAPHIYLWKLSQKYGPLMRLQLGLRPTLVFSSAKMAKAILQTHDLDFCSRPRFLGQHKLSYNALDLAFSPYNSYWREIRKICIVHLFNRNRVLLYHPIREDEISHMIEKISKSSDDLKPINLSQLLMYVTSTITCRIAFSKRYDDEGNERSRFCGLLNETQAMLGSFFVSDFLPFMSWVDRLSGLLDRLEKNFKDFDRFYQELINEHLDPNRSKPKQEDIIDVLLQIRKDRAFQVDLTFDHIKAVLMTKSITLCNFFPFMQNMFVGGTDTSAVMVIWAMTFLLKNPRSMKKVQEEVRNLIGNNGFVNADDIQGLPYLKAVIKETFRLQPAAPLLLSRETIRKCDIGGHEIPAKTLVIVNAWAIGRDPEARENPKEFYPARFIGSSIDYKGLDFELIPFGAGRRGCPGLHMGIATVELALANLLYKFDWEMPVGMNKDDLDFDVIPGVVMHKKNALCLVARKINI
ncbi:Cytochrome P450, putative [Theobroma cacao]|uniref:Cytochrome P450, putative n=1 Tax=Theobroma cacao TaxID=3641 RepID=A0A061FR60_THECC|nr:Cytochrome P450, putative [Theobroma cacao]